MFRPILRSVQRGAPRLALAGVAALAVVTVLALGPATGDATAAGKWGGAVDPDALQILKGMTDYLGSAQLFGLHTENTFDEVLETGQKIQFGFSSSVVVQRPDKLLVERSDGLASHLFVYDGEMLSTYHAEDGFFAMVSAPDNLDDLLHFARDSLDLVPPAGDMLFSNAFELLTANVTSGIVVGKAVIGGVICDHLAFTTPFVDWQVWIAEGDKPLPYKYVLTTRDDPAQPQFVTVLSDWDIEIQIRDDHFDFQPPATATQIDFIQNDVDSTPTR